MKKVWCVLISAMVICSCVFTSVSAADDLVLGSDSAVYRIVVAEDCPETDSYAAGVLADYIGRITGETPEIVTDSVEPGEFEIVIGDTDRDDHDMSARENGSYDIRTVGSNIYISGAGTRGTIYGVYGFLEKFCSCRWYTSSMSVISEAETIIVPAGTSYSYNTYFEYTDTDWVSPCDAEYSLANGLNSGVRTSLSAEQGGTVNYIGNFCHTLATQFCSPDTYFDEHPEYFAFFEGKRVPDQLCLTNEETYNIVLSEVMAILEENHDPEASVQIVSLTQNDNENYCECDACKALDEANGAHSGTMITFVNRVADAVKQAGYDNVAIDTFAYRYTRQAPTSVVPRDNVIVRLCTIECCFSHALNDDSCPENAALKNDLIAWSKICDRVYIWDYTTNYAQTLGIFPDFNVLQSNMQFFYEHSVKGVYEEGNYYMASCDTEFGELRSYLISKLLQDPYCDFDAEYNGFLEAYYGAGWQSIRDFLDICCADAADGIHLMIYDSMADSMTLDAETVAKCNALWEAAKAADITEAQLAATERSEISWRYWKACAKADEFAITKLSRFSQIEALYNDIISSGATYYCEGTALEDLATSKYLTPDNWGEGIPELVAPKAVSTVIMWLLYCIAAICSIILFVLAFRKKQYIYLAVLPLFAGMTELALWNRRAYLAWKDIDEFVLTVIIFCVVFAFFLCLAVRAKGEKMTKKKTALSAISGAAVFAVPYFAILFAVNNGMYDGAANKATIIFAFTLVAAVLATILITACKRLKALKK